MSLHVEIVADTARNAGSCNGCKAGFDYTAEHLTDKRVWVLRLGGSMYTAEVRACDSCLQELQDELDGAFAVIMAEIDKR